MQSFDLVPDLGKSLNFKLKISRPGKVVEEYFGLGKVVENGL